MKKKHTAYQILMTVLVVVFFLSAAVTLVLYLKPLYALALKLFHIPERAKLSYEVCRRNYSQLIDYNLLFGAKTLTLPDFPMSVSGHAHFQEVQGIFKLIQILAWTLLPVTLLLSLLSKKLRAYGWMKAAAITVFVLIAAVTAGLLLDGRGALILFHRILFRNENWLFDPKTDPIIRILPQEVFVSAGIVIALLMAIGAVVLLLLYRKKTKTLKKRRATARAKERVQGKKSGSDRNIRRK